MGVKYKVNENFFKKWSSDMSYLLGYIYADGSMEESKKIRAKYLRIGSIDKYLVENAKKLLDSEHIIREVDRGENRQMWYFFRIGSHKIFNDLKNLGIYQNKSKTVCFPKEIPNKFLNDFIRGYFDGDGCVYIEKAKNQKGYELVKALRVIFTSGSKKFLVDMAQTLNRAIGLNHTKVYDSRRSFQLRYNTHDSLRLFKYIYKNSPNSYLDRKFRKFLDYLKIRPEKIERTIENITKMARWRSG